MKKAGLLVLGAILFAVPALPAESGSPLHLARRVSLNAGSTLGADVPQALTIPAETEIRVRLLSGVQTQVNHIDDPVRAQLIAPLYVDGRMALPAGTYFGGTITAIHTARPFHRPGELAFHFNQITLPDGEQAPISAVISSLENTRKLHIRLDSEGHLQGRRRLSWRDLVAAAVSGGGLAAAKALSVSSTTMAAVVPATGAAFLGYELFWARGSEVDVPPQTACRLRLHNALIVHTSS